MRPMVFSLFLLGAAAAVAPAGPARGAQPDLEAQALVMVRPHAVVEDSVVRLGDLFDGVGAKGAVPLGPAPAPGGQLVVEAAQLSAIARLHGVVWRPLAGAERVVIERPGRPLPRDEVLELLRAELQPLGLDPEAELELIGFAPPMVPVAGFVHLGIEQPHFNAVTSRFATTLAVAADGMPTLRLRIAGRAVPTVPVVQSVRRLALGEVIREGDVRLVRMRAERVRPGAAQRLDQVVGKQIRRPVGAGQTFAAAELERPTLIERNTLVTMVLETPGLSLTAQGRALDSAPRGAVVPVMNLSSRAVVEAEAIAPGRVRVPLGAMPVIR